MKQLVKFAFVCTSLLIQALCALGQQASLQTNLLESQGIFAFSPMDVMVNPLTLMKVRIDAPIPLTAYTPAELDAQRAINQKVTDGIITYSPLAQEKEWTTIDFEDITPYTWKWIDLELHKEDGSLSKIHLCRPHWWMKETGADSVSKIVYLNMPEMGITGFATVTRIRINQLDTRLWNENRQGDYVSRPVTGKFEHLSNEVYSLHFGNTPTPLGVTALHPIWSVDRNTWVNAIDLQIGEKVKTPDGVTTLTSRELSPGIHKVYNLEVYRDHNYLVSTDKILVHNSCWTGRIKLGSTEISKVTMAARQASFNRDVKKNFAAIQYTDGSGSLVTKTFESYGPNAHTEDLIVKFLETNNIPFKNVLALHSEKIPCHNCTPLLMEKFKEAGTVITWDFDATNDAARTNYIQSQKW